MKKLFATLLLLTAVCVATAPARAASASEDLENIVLVGGGAYLYRKAVKRRFPKHQILEVEDPMYANVRGFQLLGEQYVRERPDQFRQAADSQVQGPVAAEVAS